MSDPRAFISFDFDNNENHKRLFAGQCSGKSPTPFSAQDWSSKRALPQREWEDLIFEKIGRCHMMFVLVSPTAHTATGVAKEINMAIEQDVPFCGVYIDGANASTPLPAGLKRNRTVGWDWNKIADAVDTMMQEGKNA
ncbi:MAG: TIR domain-containing protein [Kofleriaceae bacterium]